MSASCQVYQFPSVTEDDRSLVHSIIQSFISSKCDRNTMMAQIANILDQKGIAKMQVYGYAVRKIIDKDYHDPKTKKPFIVVHIEGNTVSDQCPCCGAGFDSARYMSTIKENITGTYDIISAVCLDCGTFYAMKAKNGRSGWNADHLRRN